MRIYLDHNATTPLCREAADAIVSAFAEGACANASSVHAEGRAARNQLESARERIADCIGASEAKEVIFTSGATEANATVLGGAAGHVVTTTTEHPSVLTPARTAGATLVPVDGEGALDLDALEQALRFAPALCSVLWANNETGVVQDVARVSELCRDRGVPLHLDASQALGKIPVDVADLGADFVSFSAHKIYGPAGVGALWSRTGAELTPLLSGGHQERGRRAGTESVALALGFAAAADRVSALLDRMDMVGALRSRLAAGLVELGGLVLGSEGLPNTLNIRFDGVDGETMLMALDMAGVALSSGSACTAGSLEPSHVLLAMGLTQDQARGAVRFSLGVGTTAVQIERTTAIVADALPRLRAVA